jgi:hypothetical protein
MIFEGFPHVDKKYQFETSEYLNSKDSIRQIPDSLVESSLTVSLKSILAESYYYISHSPSQIESIYYANSLEAKTIFSEAELDSIIKRKYEHNYLSKQKMTSFDQWIPWSHFQRYFPIWKYQLDNSKHSTIYISQKNAMVVQETSRYQRWCARFGAIPHWFYFKSLRLRVQLWIDVVLWISFFGCLLVLSGIILGFKTKLKKRKAGVFGFSPYRKKWYRWHHIYGYVIGIFILTFVFSGFMSLFSVPNWLVPVKEGSNYRQLFSRKIKDVNHFEISVNDILNHEEYNNIKQIDIKQINGKAYYQLYKDEFYKPVLLKANANILSPVVDVEALIKDELNDKLNKLKYKSEILTESDSYIKMKKLMLDKLLRVKIDDSNNTWLYFNLETSDLIKVSNSNTRLRRWLYKGLHSFDFKFFESCDWLRKLILVIISLLGLIVSYSGLVLTFNYLSRKIRRWKN